MPSSCLDFITIHSNAHRAHSPCRIWIQTSALKPPKAYKIEIFMSSSFVWLGKKRLVIVLVGAVSCLSLIKKEREKSYIKTIQNKSNIVSDEKTDFNFDNLVQWAKFFIKIQILLYGVHPWGSCVEDATNMTKFRFFRRGKKTSREIFHSIFD